LIKALRFKYIIASCAFTVLSLWLITPAYAQNDDTAIDKAFSRLYNFDFTGAHSLLDAHIQSYPEDPLGYSVKGAIHFFSELNRLHLLETEFFSNDDKVTDKKRIKPDPAMRSLLFSATAEARKKAAACLAQRPNDRSALFALSMATGLETEYTILVEKKYVRSYSLSKENQRYARQLLALNPPFYDAYVTIGSAEYVVANLNFVFRLLAHFEDIKGSRQKAIENLRAAIDHGRYYQPYAKIILTVVYLREKRIHEALALMCELEHDFPENPLFKKEAALLAEKASKNNAQNKKSAGL
jgi:hypothetical protein